MQALLEAGARWDAMTNGPVPGTITVVLERGKTVYPERAEHLPACERIVEDWGKKFRRLKAVELFTDESKLQDLDNFLDNFTCPISFQFFKHPVVAADGHTYEREAIQKWFRGDAQRGLQPHNTSPKTNQRISRTLVTNHQLKKVMDALGYLRKD